MAVYATVGLGGRGKTLSTVARLWKKYKEGRPIWSNTPLVDLRLKFDHNKGCYVPYDDETFGESWAENYVYNVDDVLKACDCELLLDELGAWLPADEHKDIPRSFRRLITQDRRNGLNIWWTYRHTRVWNEIRDNTVEYRYCYRYGPMIFQRCVDAEDAKGKPVYAWFWVEPSVFDLYQTWAEVGDRNGKGYGVGSMASKRGLVLTGWGPHDLTISVKPEQLKCLRRKFPERFGLEPENSFPQLGLVRKVDRGGVVRYYRASDIPLPPPLPAPEVAGGSWEVPPPLPAPSPSGPSFAELVRRAKEGAPCGS